MVVVNYHDDLKEVQGDAALAPLLAAPWAQSPFGRIEWWRGLAEHCGFNPFIAVASSGDTRAVLPMAREDGHLAALANWYNFTTGPLFSPGADQTALVSALARDLAQQTKRITLAPLPDERGETSALELAFRTAGWVVLRSQCDVNHVLEVQGRRYADYLAGRPGQLRTTLKRKASKVTVTIETEFSPASWAAYETIYASSWKSEEGSPAFLREFAQAEAAAGRMRLGLAHADGQPVAAQFWTVEHGTAFIHKLAHTEASKPLSPGTTLSAALFQHVIDRDHVTLVDFGTGDDGYKRDWMESVRPRYRLELLRPGYPGNWPRIAKARLRALLPRG